jgi:hypothetical protein
MAESGVDTERTVVKTYVPAYQREEWDDHAEELDVSRSEFVRSMVQAGRRGFEGTQPPACDDSDEQVEGGADVESTVLETLSADEYLSWDQLLAAVTEDIEDRLEATLQQLQAADRVRYSGRNGGYTLEE